MRKLMIVIMLMLFISVLSSCKEEVDEQLVALQTQYDSYRINGFGDMDQFIDFMNIFSLETMRSNVYITVETRINLLTTVTEQRYGIIIHQDLSYYYAITDMTIFGAGKNDISLQDVYNVMHIGEVASVDATNGIALIRFPKTIDKLEVSKAADAIPFQDEPVILISQLNGIRSHMTLGQFNHSETGYDFVTDVLLDASIIGGGIYDVNHRLVAIDLTGTGKNLVMYDVLFDLINSVL